MQTDVRTQAERSARLWRGITPKADTVQVYEIRLYDEVLGTFEARMNAVGIAELRLDIQSFSNLAIVPLEFASSLSHRALVAWLRTRTVPKHQEFARSILRSANVDPDDLLAQVGLSLGLSLADAYWVAPAGLDLTWDEVNLFHNDNDDVLSLAAYTGELVDTSGNSLLSTSWATGGQFAKAWRRLDDGTLSLYKAGSERAAANLGQEPWSEYVASQVAEACGIEHVAYGLDVWKGKLASTCALMNDEHVALVPSYLVVGTGSFQRAMAAYAALGSDALAAFCDMAVFDALIANTDRHAGNYAFLRDARTGEVQSIAPLYDHNLALFSHDLPSDYHAWCDASRLADWGMRPAGGEMTFDQQARLALGPRQAAMLEQMADISLTSVVGEAAVPEDRLGAWETYLRTRSRQLLALPRLSADERTQIIADQGVGRSDLPAARLDLLPPALHRLSPLGLGTVSRRK